MKLFCINPPNTPFFLLLLLRGTGADEEAGPVETDLEDLAAPVTIRQRQHNTKTKIMRTLQARRLFMVLYSWIYAKKKQSVAALAVPDI